MGDAKTDKVQSWFLAALIGLVVVLPLIYTPWTFEIFAIPKVTLLRVVGSLLLIALAGGSLRQKRFAFSKAHVPALAFLALVLISTLTSVHPPTSLLGLRNRYFGLLTQIALFGCYLAAYRVSWSKVQIRKFLLANAGVSLLVSIIGIAQSLGSQFPVDLNTYFANHAYSMFGNPNFLGVYLVMVAPLSLGLALFSAIPRDRWLGGVSAVAAVATIFLTASSGAIVALLVGGTFFSMVYFIPRQFDIRSRRALTAFVAVAILAALITSPWLVRGETVSWQSRVRGWHAAYSSMLRYPLLGSGPDSTRFTFPHLLTPLKGYNEEMFEDAHNLPLTTATTLGVPALALFLALLGLVLHNALKELEAPATGERDRLVLTVLLTSIVGYLTASIVNPDFVVSLAIFWILLGIAVALTDTQRHQLRVPAAVALPALTLTILVCVAATLISVGSYASEYFLARAEESPGMNASLHYYRLAQSANPFYDLYSIRVSERLLELVGKGNPTVDGLALRYAKKAIRQSPREANNYVVLGTIYRRLARASGRRAQLQTAADAYRRSLTENPYQMFGIKLLAEVDDDLGRRQEAAKLRERYDHLFGKRQLGAPQ